jgi:hypothetical protein
MNHILVPRAAIPTDRVLSFELFVKVNDHFVKVANKGEKIDPERINRYLSHDRDVLYIDKNALERFMDERFDSIFDMISNQNSPLEIRFDWFIRCLELGFVDLKVVGLHADKFMRIQMLIEWCFEYFRKRELRFILLRVAYRNIEQMLTKRALFGAALTLTLVMEQNDTPPGAFRSLFTGALLRDISLFHIDGQEDPHMGRAAEMSEADFEEWRKHPYQTVETLRKYIAVDDALRAIIEQHHELPRGGGFPRGLKRAEIYQPAQYLGLADFCITAFEKLRRIDPQAAETEAALIHLKKIMPEENAKNLPLLLRVLAPVFS